MYLRLDKAVTYFSEFKHNKATEGGINEPEVVQCIANVIQTTFVLVMAAVLVILGNRAYVYILLLCVTFYSAVFPFVAFAPDFFFHKFGMSTVESGKVTSLLPLGTMVPDKIHRHRRLYNSCKYQGRRRPGNPNLRCKPGWHHYRKFLDES